MAKKCRYIKCVRVISDGSRFEDCPACRQRYRYWKGKSPTKRLRRRRQLELSGETMAEFISDTILTQFVRREFKKEVKRNG